MRADQLQSWLLRLVGSTEILAFVAVVMPRAWMETSHAWLGLGEMPDGPIIMFMIRQASYAYGMHGLSLWILASDVNRFRPIVLFNGISFLLAAPVFFLIDYHSRMPWSGLPWTQWDARFSGQRFCGSIEAHVLVRTKSGSDPVATGANNSVARGSDRADPVAACGSDKADPVATARGSDRADPVATARGFDKADPVATRSRF